VRIAAIFSVGGSGGLSDRLHQCHTAVLLGTLFEPQVPPGANRSGLLQGAISLGSHGLFEFFRKDRRKEADWPFNYKFCWYNICTFIFCILVN